MTTGFATLCQQQIPIAFGTLETEHPGGTRQMRVVSVRVDEARRTAALVQLAEFTASGEVVDVAESEVYVGTHDEAASPSAWSEAMDDAVHALRDAIGLWLPKLSGQLSSMIFAVWPPLSIFDLLDRWDREGPPQRPERFADAERVAERLANDIVLRSEVDLDIPDARAAIEIAGWTWVVVIHDQDGFESGGELVLVSPEHERAVVVVREIDGNQSLTASPFDGDTVTMRSVLVILVLALLLSGQDLALGQPSEDEEDENEDDEDDEDEGGDMASAFFGDAVPSLCQYLLFRDGEHPLVDHRLQGDALGEGELCDGYLVEQREAHPQTAALFDRFVRECIDPSYVARPSAS
ncbi:hypothetical protein ACNOYE_28900 [Nannocystaceae bacterium ST9]